MAIRFTVTLQTLIALIVALGLSIGATAMIRANVKGNIAEERIPLPVAITRYELIDQYQRTSNYIGTVRATSESSVGFEIGGQLATMAVSEGTRVEAGQILATLDTERRLAQLAGAKAQLAQVSADLALAEKRSVRTQDLVERGLASQQSLDDVVLGAESLRAARAAAAASLRDAEIQIDKSALRAPYDAVVAERLAQPGAAVGVGVPVLRLVTASRREAHVGIPAPTARQLARGQRYALRLNERRFEATLRALRDDLDPSTLTLGAVFELPADVPASVGESVQLELQSSVPAAGGWLPLSALIEGERGLWTVLAVAEVDGRKITVRESVEVVYVQGDQAFVRGTLTDDTAVVATGLQRISPGSAIDPRPLASFSASADSTAEAASQADAG